MKEKFLKPFTHGKFYSLPELQASGFPSIARMPVSLRIVLESVLRNCGTTGVGEEDVKRLASWTPTSKLNVEIPFKIARVILQDFTGVPLLVDLAAMRQAVANKGGDPKKVEPLVPVDLVVDHSVQVDFYGTKESYTENLEVEFRRNAERYRFLKWGQQAFKTFGVVPPGIGIVHQVNLEHLARVVFKDGEIFYPDTLVGTDSHTTMVNGLGVVGWGVGGIEAEAGMLGQPVYFLTPEVVGVHLTGKLREGVTATDLTLRVTELLRKAKVVDKFVEFFGVGAATLPVADRATIANMAPEYGATMGFFPIDEKTIDYLRLTGREEKHLEAIEAYFRAQNLWGIPKSGEVDYSQVLELDLSSIVPSVAGPKRPQDRIELTNLKNKWNELLHKSEADGGYGIAADAPRKVGELGNGDVLIAAITSCTNTSNPYVMIAAGLVAKKAHELGLKPPAYVKTSLAPGSRVVTEYLDKTGLTPHLNALGFNLVGYGCTTCIGNSGPLSPEIEAHVTKNNIVATSVLSGNRNFEARIHAAIKGNFLMSPPLVVAFALAGRVDIDFEKEPIATSKDGKPVMLKDLWPTADEVEKTVRAALTPEMFKRRYASIATDNPDWTKIAAPVGHLYSWHTQSTYIQEPPFFSQKTPQSGAIKGARILAIFGDSVTTDHISPAGSIGKMTPAGKYLEEHGVKYEDFNSYGSRRGNDRIMTRGTFANVRIKNKLADGKEGGWTKLFLSRGSTSTSFTSQGVENETSENNFHSPHEETKETELVSIFDASMAYQKAEIPLVIFSGLDYGMGSSRDWAAKGTRLLGVRAVVAKSFERIHRSNLIGMGVIPMQLATASGDVDLKGDETIDIPLPEKLTTGLLLNITATRPDGTKFEIPVKLRVDTDAEIAYLAAGGILPFVRKQIENR